jgi:hypothetical protein
MKSFIKTLFLLLIATTLLKCTNIKDSDNVLYKLTSEEFPVALPLLLNDLVSTLDLSNIIDTFTFTPLETHHNALIAHHGLIEYFNGRVFYFDDIIPKAFSFSSDGKFQNTLINIGKGPKEMVQPYSMYLDRHTEQLIFCDRPRNSLHFVSLDGDYIKEVKLNMWVQSVRRIDENSFILLTDNNDINLHIATNDFKTIMPIDIKIQKENLYIRSSCLPFSNYDGTVNYILGFSDTVINISCRGYYNRYILDFGNYKMPEKYVQEGNVGAFANKTQRYAGSIFNFCETTDHLFMNFNTTFTAKPVSLLVSKSTSEFKYFQKVKLAGFVFERGWFQRTGDWFVGSIFNYHYDTLANDEAKILALSDQEQKLRQAILEKKPTDNPIYVFFKLKADF